jgi:Tol biopolymer transport system component
MVEGRSYLVSVDEQAYAWVTADRTVLLRNGGRLIKGVSLSPDGNRLVFSAKPYGQEKRDIFVTSLDGTKEQNLTNQSGSNRTPTWSPDGQYVFFTSDRDGQRQIYRIRNDGSELKKISEHPIDDDNYNLSPDGKHIVLEQRYRGARPQEASLILISADGINQNVRALVRGGWKPRWSPDGQWILHKRAGDRGAWIIRPDGSGEYRIDANGWELAWTPDSRAFFYHRDRNIYLINIDGTGNKLVLRNVDVGFSPLPRCSWDISGTRLAIALDTGIGDNKRGIVLLSPQGDLLADYRNTVPHNFRNACWSPDGKAIWFVKSPMPQEATCGIYTINEDGTEEKQIVSDSVVWKPMQPATEKEIFNLLKEKHKEMLQ